MNSDPEPSVLPAKFTVGILSLYAVFGIACILLGPCFASASWISAATSRKSSKKFLPVVIAYRLIYLLLSLAGLVLCCLSLLKSLNGNFPPLFAFLGLFTGEVSWYLRSACKTQFLLSLLGLLEPGVQVVLGKEVQLLQITTKAFTVVVAELALKFPAGYLCLQIGGNFGFNAFASFYLLLEVAAEKVWDPKKSQDMKSLQMKFNLAVVVIGCLLVGGLVHWLQLLFFLWILGPNKFKEEFAEIARLREKVQVKDSPV
jgi:hypothetical protein